jgi:hypothetical protein
MFMRALGIAALLAFIIGATAVSGSAQDGSQNVPAQLSAIQQQLTSIQNTLGTQGSGLSSLAAQLSTLQTKVNSIQTQVNSVQTQLGAGVTVKTRKFYLTKDFFDGSTSESACATGYHMAGLYEIHDPSSFQYDTTLGESGAGSGPPSTLASWIGSDNVGEDNIPGERDCAGFNDSGDYGTVAYLASNWTSDGKAISPWQAETRTCDTKLRVWCVQD